MTKSNNKKHRTDGTVHSGNIEFPAPVTSVNTPSSAYSYTDDKKIEEASRQNKRF